MYLSIQQLDILIYNIRSSYDIGKSKHITTEISCINALAKTKRCVEPVTYSQQSRTNNDLNLDDVTKFCLILHLSAESAIRLKPRIDQATQQSVYMRALQYNLSITKSDTRPILCITHMPAIRDY